MALSKQLIQSAWLAPMATPMIRDGAVVIEGQRVIVVGPATQLRGAHPDAIVEDLGQSILLPGLVNAHVHLELSCATQIAEPGSFVEWLKQVISLSPTDPEAFARAGVEEGWRQCRRFGVTAVGDISRQHRITRTMQPTDGLAPLTVSYGEIQAMAQRRGLLEERLAAASGSGSGAVTVMPGGGANSTSRRIIGLSPHAPYSVEADGFRRALQTARDRRLPLATHLAEDPAEVEFLADHTGPFRELWAFLGAWDDCVPRFSGGPIRYAKSLGLLDYPTLLAHVNECDDQELSLLAEGRASVVYCPRTHRYFSRRPHRFGEMLARGINVALGTDSCASSPNLNLLDDLRLVHQIAPEMNLLDLWSMATTRAARAMGVPDIGQIAPRNWADLVCFNAIGSDPLRAILESSQLPTKVWLAGRLWGEA